MIAPARPEYRVVVVGAGVIGLYTAYHLLKGGFGPVLVVDRGFLSSGASGRNGGGVRQQWETQATVRLARESVAAYRRFGSDFGYNVWFRQGGYLFLASSAAEVGQLRSVHAVVQKEGLASRLLAPNEVPRYAAGLALDGVHGASFLRSDGTLYPFPAIWGLYEAIRSLGGEVLLGTEVLSVARDAGRVSGVSFVNGSVKTSVVVNAAGGWSKEFSARAGLAVVNQPSRHEILATEPLKPFLDPMVVRLSDGLYFSQTMRGEIVGGLTVPHPPGIGAGMATSPHFLTSMARALSTLVPRLRSLGVLRAWSGFYDDTPDGLPVIGEDPRLTGFVHANGFGGHGFMLAPAAAQRVAKSVMGEGTDLDPAMFAPGRFLGAPSPATVERLQLG
ncbi:MAG: FAD-binding oxidoreductase [Thermoplasmata archaeon]|nr:FAD-binding oxidoreductase [Thermoplasmata archaeon]